MSWFQNQRELGFFFKLAFNILKSGNVPQHVAIIMDGNRRFARKHGIENKIGHSKGFEKLAEVLYWCFELGIPEVTVYAFSTENFKRSDDEVDCLMSLAKEKFDRLIEEKDMMIKHQVCVRVIGDVTLLPKDVQSSIARVVEFSKNFSRSILNVAIAYSSRHEITQVVKDIAFGVKERMIKNCDITELLIEQCLYTNKSRDVDLLIRTSGEVRLSDFLMWQSSYSMLSFVEELWPEFSIWQFMSCILSYQLKYNMLKDTHTKMKLRQKKELEELDLMKAQEKILAHLKTSSKKPESYHNMLDEETTNCKQGREDRVAKFLHYLDMKRNEYITRSKCLDPQPSLGIHSNFDGTKFHSTP